MCINTLGGHRIEDGVYVGLKYILEFNLETETWTEISKMKEGRHAHAVSVVSYDDFAKWCNSEPEKTTEPPR